MPGSCLGIRSWLKLSEHAFIHLPHLYPRCSLEGGQGWWGYAHSTYGKPWSGEVKALGQGGRASGVGPSAEGCVFPFPLTLKVGPGPEAEAALDSGSQEASRPGAPGSERILLDILEHDWREAQDSKQELCQKLHAVQGELQWAEELRDKVRPPCAISQPALPPPSFLLTAWGGSWDGEGDGHHQFT